MNELDRKLDRKLIDAAIFRCTEQVRWALDHGADVHADDDLALCMASENGHTDTVRLLLERGADIHACKYEVLRVTSQHGHIDTAILLLRYIVAEEMKEQPEDRDDRDGCVTDDVIAGFIRLVKVFLEDTQDVEFLYHSAFRGYAKLARQILNMEGS